MTHLVFSIETRITTAYCCNERGQESWLGDTY